MKRFLWLSPVLLLALLVVLPAAGADKSKGKNLYQQGQKAEARQDYEEAYRCYRKLYDEHPERTEYRSAYERTKFLAGAAHVHKGQVLREAGKLSEALKEFQLGVMVDPSSTIARQEIQRTQQLIDKAQQTGTPQSRAPHEVTEASQNLAGPVELAPISQTPITLKLSEDSKVVYETVGKLAGVNVLFDPAYTGKRIKVELNGVSLEQSLQVIALLSKTFWRPVTSNTIFISDDTAAKRTELEQQVLRTFYLNNFSTVSELQDVANLIRTILKVDKVQQFPAQNAIVMRGTPDQAALAELLINNLDKAKSEVVVDVVVMQVSKDKLRQLGLQYPFQGSSSNPTVSLQLPTTTSSSSTTTTTSSSSSNLTLNNFIDLNATDFSISIPSMSAAFLLSDNNTTILQRPQLRSVDGQKATLKIGERVPVATGTSSSTLTSTALSTTQFQYQDVGVNIEMTPHIHGDNEVTLKVTLEVSAIDSYETIGTISEPVIGQRKVDHEIRLRDGEVNLIGGIMEHQDVRNMSGMPWFSQIPGLKYLFGQGSKQITDTETVFALMPHVVRRLDVNDINLRSIEVGTQNVVEVRHLSRPPAAVVAPVPSAAPAASPVTSAPVTVPHAVPAAGAPEAYPAAVAVTPATAPQAPQPGVPAVLSLDPPVVNQPAGATFTVNVIINGGQNVYSVPVQISYDTKLLQVINVSNAGGLSRDGAAVSLVQRNDVEHGLIQVSMLRPPGAPGITPQGAIFSITFQAKAAGQATVAIGPTVLKDPNQGPVPAVGSQAIVTIR